MRFLEDELAALEAQDLRRALRRHRDCPGRFIEVDGERLLNFSSNNYLGLAGSPRMAEAAARALSAGTGSTASRLVTGNLDAHEALEADIAALHGLPAARLFGSGYQANVGLLSCLAGPDDLIVSDRLNHASIIDGIRLSKATCRIAEHASIASFAQHLREAFPEVEPPSLLEQATHDAGAASPNSSVVSHRYRRCFVVTDSVFSMDGDLAPLEALRSLCDHYGAFLIVDEAHAVGCLGSGRGICHEVSVVPDAVTGGFGKALGCYGGYVAGSKALCELLLNRARSFVFSTALPPAVVGCGREAIAMVREADGSERRQRLEDRIRQMADGLSLLGKLERGAGRSPIFPFLVGEPTATLALTERLRSAGYFCQAIRPPTVPSGTSRLRIALSSEHEAEDITGLLGALRST